jgi:hypothetical protein
VLLGAFVAGWRRTKRRSPAQARQLELVAMAAGIVLLLAWWSLDGTASVTYWGGLLGASLLAAVVVAAAADPRSRTLGALLGARPLVGLGLISYGLYLWHWPVYVVLSSNRTGLDGLALLGLRLVVTFAISIASFVLLERPIRSLRPGGWWEGARGRSMTEVAAATEGVEVVDLDAWLCPDGTCRERLDGTTARSDGVHFQGPGGSIASQWLLGEVVRGAGLEVGELDQDRKDTPEYRATVRVCSSYADLTAITQGQVAELMASQEARDGLVDSLDNFDAQTLADLPPEVADDLDGLADPGFQAWARTLLDRLARGEQVRDDELPRVTIDGVALGLERLRTLC